VVKKRLIPLMLLKDGRLVKGKQFSSYKDVGDPVKSAAVYNSQLADELIILNIGSSSIQPLLDILDELSKVCFMPIALGGGIRSVEDAVTLIRHGADKVVVNTLCKRMPTAISRISELVGRQALICAIDVRWDEELGDYVVYTESGKCKETISLNESIQTMSELGAGEIFIQSIDRDGTAQGYDVELASRVVEIAPKLPVIAAGGCGDYRHLKELFLDADVEAAACGSIFNFSDSNPIRAKAFLNNYDIKLKKV